MSVKDGYFLSLSIQTVTSIINDQNYERDFEDEVYHKVKDYLEASFTLTKLLDQ